MYAIIYWISDNKVYPLLTSNGGQIKLFESLKKADEAALDFENDSNDKYKNPTREEEVETRVISIEGVQ